MIQTVYRFLLYPWVLLSFYAVPRDESDFDSLSEVNEYHFSYDYSFDTVVLCYTWLPVALVMMSGFWFARWIDGKVQAKLRGEGLE